MVSTYILKLVQVLLGELVRVLPQICNVLAGVYTGEHRRILVEVMSRMNFTQKKNKKTAIPLPLIKLSVTHRFLSQSPEVPQLD